MVDVLKALNFEYITTNPGSSFQGLHESIINYGGNTKPELLTCCHEESAVAMAHGYAKIEGKPIMALLHGTVGTQHGSMAIYNAYADRVPIFVMIGNHMDAAVRPAGVNWYHSAQDMAALIRDYTKWDDNPASLGAMANSSIRAYRMMMTPPMGPVAIVIDSDMQEKPMPGARPRIPKLTVPALHRRMQKASASARWIYSSRATFRISNPCRRQTWRYPAMPRQRCLRSSRK